MDRLPDDTNVNYSSTPEIKEILSKLDTSTQKSVSDILDKYYSEKTNKRASEVDFTDQYLIYTPPDPKPYDYSLSYDQIPKPSLEKRDPYYLENPFGCEHLSDIYNFTMVNKSEVFATVNEVFSVPFLFTKDKIKRQ